MSDTDKAGCAKTPLKRPVVVLLAVWCVFIFVAFCDAGSELLVVLPIFYGGLLWGIVWVVRLIRFLMKQRSGLAPEMPRGRALFYWGIEPATFVFTVALGLSGIFWQIRFRLSASAFDAYAAEVIAGRVALQRRDSDKRWVGLFRVKETELLEDGVVRLITAADGFDDAGFARSPNSPPPIVGEDSYTHIVGPWYRWHRSW